MSFATGTETLLHDLLHAQADSVDVAIRRPLVEQLADVVSITDRRRGARRTVATVIAVAATIAIIVGVVAIRPSDSSRGGPATGTGMRVVNVGPPVVQYDLPRAPSGYHTIASDTAIWIPRATCLVWTVDAAELRCSNLVGTVSHSYATASTRIDVVSGRLTGVGNYANSFASGERVIVRGHSASLQYTEFVRGQLVAVDTSKPPVPASTVYALVSWNEPDGTTVLVRLIETAAADWPRTRVVDLANLTVPNGGAQGTVGLSFASVSGVVRGSRLSEPLSVFGPRGAPCIIPGVGDCLPFDIRRAGVAFTITEPVYAKPTVTGETDDAVRFVRLRFIDHSSVSTPTAVLPGYTGRFFVLQWTSPQTPFEYDLLDAAQHVITTDKFPS